MSLKLTAGSKDVPTLLTMVDYFFGVDVPVLRVRSSIGKPLSTVLTAVWFLTSMSELVKS